MENAVCLRFGRMLGLDVAVPDAAVSACVANQEYFNNLLLSKGHLKLISHLVNTAPALDKAPSPDEILCFLNQWEEKLHYADVKTKYLKRHSRFFRDIGKTCVAAVDISGDCFREVYLDYNSTAPLRPEVERILADYAAGRYGYGNPSALSASGYLAAKQIADARSTIAKCLHAKPEDIVFTGSGSAANNLAIKGLAFRNMEHKGHILTTKLEHKSVLESLEFIGQLGFEIEYIPNDSFGMVHADDVDRLIRHDTILVCVMAANNEIGTLNPIKDIGQICQRRNVPLLIDAVQAFGKLDIDPYGYGASLLSISGHKLGAPKGIGALWIRDDIELTALIHGGGQESGLSSGTENVGHIIAFAKAASLACLERASESRRFEQLYNSFVGNLKGAVPNCRVNGHPEQRLKQNISISFPNADSRALLLSLAKVGITVSISSACSSKRVPNSHVLEAIGIDDMNATIRIGMGKSTTAEDMDYLLKNIVEAVAAFH